CARMSAPVVAALPPAVRKGSAFPARNQFSPEATPRAARSARGKSGQVAALQSCHGRGSLLAGDALEVPAPGTALDEPAPGRVPAGAAPGCAAPPGCAGPSDFMYSISCNSCSSETRPWKLGMIGSKPATLTGGVFGESMQVRR